MKSPTRYERWTGARTSSGTAGHAVKSGDARVKAVSSDRLKTVAQNDAATLRARAGANPGSAGARPAAADRIKVVFLNRVAAQPDLPAGALPAPSTELTLRQAREEFERAYFEQLLACGGVSLSRIAALSGLERTHLYRKLKSLGIKVAKKDKAA